MVRSMLDLGSEQRRYRYKPEPYWSEHYWQVDVDPGQYLPIEYMRAKNRTQKQTVFCNHVFGAARCPSPANYSSASNGATSGGLLFYATLGRLSNCLLVLELARWLAEQLDKDLVVPLCSSGESTEQSCTPGSIRADHKEINLLVNLTAVYSRDSMGGCRQRRDARDMRDVLNVVPRSGAKEWQFTAGRTLTCVGRTAFNCAWMLGSDHKFSGLSLRSFVNLDLGRLAVAWLEFVARGRASDANDMHGSRALRRALRRQDDGEACTPYVASLDCSCQSASCDARIVNRRVNSTLPPCLRDCQGRSIFDATAGDIFVPTLFDHGGLNDPYRQHMCSPMTLSDRAMAQADALRKSLPARFVCMHWRAGDFLSPDPLGRLHQASMLSMNRALANASFMASAAERAALNVKVGHVLVLTNARWERQQSFEQALASGRHGIRVTMRACSGAPPDAEKEVCARSATALVLSSGSSFSTHLHRMAPHGLPIEYIAPCPTPKSSLWKTGLLAGEPIACT